MTTTNEAFEALMPEPVGRIYGYVSGRARVEWFRRPGENRDPLYTVDQMRAMFDAATERAAAICNNEAEDHAALKNMQASIGCDGCAAAIRAGGEKT